MSSSAGNRSQSRASGHRWPWQASTGAQLSLTATHRLRQGWMKLRERKTKCQTMYTGKHGSELLGNLWTNIQSKKRSNKIYLRVETDGGDDGAEEGLGLRVAACLQQGLPVLGPWHHLALQVAVAQEIGQTHLWVSYVFADLHLVRDGDAAGGLPHVKCH